MASKTRWFARTSHLSYFSLTSGDGTSASTPIVIDDADDFQTQVVANLALATNWDTDNDYLIIYFYVQPIAKGGAYYNN